MSDPREAFIAGARWWADLNQQLLDDRIPLRADGGGAAAYPLQGTWPATYPGRAFVEGARKQEYLSTGATMWQSDQHEAEWEALRRYPLDSEKKD